MLFAILLVKVMKGKYLKKKENPSSTDIFERK